MKNLYLLPFALLFLTGCAETYIGSYAIKKMVYKEAGYSAPAITGKRKVGNPYMIMGKTYYPVPSSDGYRRTGVASWYGKDFHGKKTANGEIYNMYDMTAAHPTLPLPTYVRVTHLENGRSIIVRVNDRGPFLRGRVIDLSYAAASQLNMVDQGTAPVLLEALPTDGSSLRVAHNQSMPTADELPKTPRKRWTDKYKSPQLNQVSAAGSRIETPVVEEGNINPSDSVAVGHVNIYVQTGAFGNLDNALKERDNLLKRFNNVLIQETRKDAMTLHRVRIGPIESVSEADVLLSQIIQAGWYQARIAIE